MFKCSVVILWLCVTCDKWNIYIFYSSQPLLLVLFFIYSFHYLYCLNWSFILFCSYSILSVFKCSLFSQTFVSSLFRLSLVKNSELHLNCLKVAIWIKFDWLIKIPGFVATNAPTECCWNEPVCWLAEVSSNTSTSQKTLGHKHIIWNMFSHIL